MKNQEILRVDHLTKIYPGGVLANFEIDFSVNHGEIHALIGENGAGKSTLMKCLFGIEEVTDGKIFLNGAEVRFANSQDAIKHGIGMVQQNMMLVPSLTVAQNLVLGLEPRKGIIIDRKKSIEITKEISAKYNLHVEAEKLVRDISVGMKQKLEILKTMYRGAKIIILDEPTAVLAPQETQELFQQLLNLKEQGYAIIFISHKLGEVKFLCDRMTILKGGRSLGTFISADITEKEIAQKMVGREVSISYKKSEGTFEDRILEVCCLKYKDKFNVQKVDNVSFSLRAGEILGIAGIEGNGQSELMEILTGNLPADEGEVIYQGQDICNQPIHTIREKRIAHVSEDRSYNGCAPEMSLRDNLIATALKRFSSKAGLLQFKQIENYCKKSVKDFQIKAHTLNAPIKSLSGGNIQKAIVAREFSGDVEVIMLNQPTRGVDVGAMEFIHQKILEMRQRKKSTVLLSSDLSELKALSDRIIVMYKGKVVGVIDDVSNASDEELGLYMLGLKRDTAEKLVSA